MDNTARKQIGLLSNSQSQGSPTRFQGLPQPSMKPKNSPDISPSAAMPPSRSDTLSWQQRPSSRGSKKDSVGSRPLSSLTSEKHALKLPRLGSPTALEPNDGVSRSQIAQSLAAKDPAFFKQTQDRGLGSAAYRKSQVETMTDSGSTGTNRKLPGMSSESRATIRPHESPPLDSTRTDTSLGERSNSGSTGQSGSYQASPPTSLNGTSSPETLSQDSQRLARPLSSTETTASLGDGDVSLIGRRMAMSPSQGRISIERADRPPSPTKGVGGFVQSAMMKRSDSVNKRWSAQTGLGISRGNSIASSRGGLDSVSTMRYPLGGVTPLADSRNSSSREATPSATSRPTSSQDNTAVIPSPLENQISAAGLPPKATDSEHSVNTFKPITVLENPSRTPPRASSPTKSTVIASTPSSPSKRWSPTKSSWLENAISKPESPKLLSSLALQPPAWKTDFNRNKQQRGSVDLGNSPAFKEVAFSGLIRTPSPATGYKPPSIGGLSKGLTTGPALEPKTSVSGNQKSSDTSDPMKKASKRSDSSTSPIVSGEIRKFPTSPSASHQFSQKDFSVKSPKLKPETPPKKDFRSALKPQRSPGEVKDKHEPEFKNVFGKLKKTQTQNYVAPDELKSNIMRGKSGLTKTDGPQKVNVRDEFKESILKKKEGMIAPSASTTIVSTASKGLDTSRPEAIAERIDLGRSQSSKEDDNTEERKPIPRSDAPVKPQSPQNKPKIITSRGNISTPLTNQQTPNKPEPGLGVGFASSLAGMLQRGPSPIGGIAKPSPVPQDDAGSSERPNSRNSTTQHHQKGAELTHVTKGRARGPKRKPPTSIQKANDASDSKTSSELPLKPSVPQGKPPTSSPIAKREVSPDSSAPRPLNVITNYINNDARKIFVPNKPHKPYTENGPTLNSRLSPMSSREPSDQLATQIPPMVRQKPMQSPDTSKTQSSPKPMSPKTSDQIQFPRPSKTGQQGVDDLPVAQGPEKPQAQQSVKGMARSPEPMRSSQSKPPVKLPTQKDKDAAVTDAALQPREVVRLGITSPAKTPQISHQETASPAIKSPRSPPLPGRKPATLVTESSTAHSPSPAPSPGTSSPLKRPPESSPFFTEIFDEPPTGKTKINIDTQTIIDKPPFDEHQKIKTLRKQIFEITDNGKAVPVPSQQEHILFEDSLYICTHVFGTPAGTRTSETYLWCGDGVSPSAVEDAHLFAKKTAKDNNGKLITLLQGKETSNFFQALGGIVITRKGSSSRSDSAIYMLCGRQHLGQLAFDEVEFQPRSLCTGFPYIVSARGGRLYLWKGSGASADELGCARLIGMDLGLTGEIEEVDEDKEPADFWTAFPVGASKPTNVPSVPQHWRLKPSCDRYATKLFTVDVEVSRPKSSSSFMSWGRRGSVPTSEAGSAMEAKIKEVTPFSQADLCEGGVFVLDAFFEIFVYDLSPTASC